LSILALLLFSSGCPVVSCAVLRLSCGVLRTAVFRPTGLNLFYRRVLTYLVI